MSDPISVIVAAYPDRAAADAAAGVLKELSHRGDVTLLDAAVIEQDANGKLRVDELTGMTGRTGAIRGALIGGLLGLIFPPSLLVGAAIGAATGGLVGRLRDRGVDANVLKQAAAELRPGQAGIVVVVEQAAAAGAADALGSGDRLAELLLRAEAAAVLTGDPAAGAAGGGGFARTAAGTTTVGFAQDPAGVAQRPKESPNPAGADAGSPPTSTTGGPTA